MSKKPSPQWHSEVKALRELGIDPKVIAVQMDKSVTAILWVLNEHGEREAQRTRARECMRRTRLRESRKSDEPKQNGAVKVPARAVPRETIDQAVRDFADHKIDRATLMARITP
jgi:hypothetical protein